MNKALKKLNCVEQNIVRSFTLVRNDIVRMENEIYALWLRQRNIEERLQRLEQQRGAQLADELRARRL